MAQCRPRQLTYARNLLTKRFPAYHQDFTRLFPRVLCLYIFSFLDPRSLCRAAQVNNCFFFIDFLGKMKVFLSKVCWYWKFLTESEQIWMPKCLRFGWTPKYNPSPYETNVWKRVYSFNIQALQTMPVRVWENKCSFFFLLKNEQINILVPLTSSENTYVQTIWTGEVSQRQFVNNFRDYFADFVSFLLKISNTLFENIFFIQ